MKEINAEQIRDLVDTDSPTILEIGCNDGTDTLRFLEAMPGAEIYCFEPDPRAIARFRETVNDDRVVLTPIALGDYTGFAKFYGSSGIPSEKSRNAPNASHYHKLAEWDLSGSLSKPTGHLQYSPWVTFPKKRTIEVGITTLDDWLLCHTDITKIDFVWMDVQGAEHKVIQGAFEGLSIIRYFYTEYSNTPMYEEQIPLTAIQKMLPNYKLLGIYGPNALLRNEQFNGA